MKFFQFALTVVLFAAAGYFVGYLMEPKEPQETHIHGWAKWETDTKGYNGLGLPRVEQHRVCTNCGYVQSEIH